MSSLVQPPDLLIYLRASVPTLVSRIQKRGRDYENTIRIDYLTRLNERYEAWVMNYKLGKLLVINVNDTDFKQAKDLSKVINKVDAELHGIF